MSALSRPMGKIKSRRADSNRLPLLQLRVYGQWFLGIAQSCKTRIGIGSSVPCVAHYCRVARADQGQTRVSFSLRPVKELGILRGLLSHGLSDQRALVR